MYRNNVFRVVFGCMCVAAPLFFSSLPAFAGESDSRCHNASMHVSGTAATGAVPEVVNTLLALLGPGFQQSACQALTYTAQLLQWTAGSLLASSLFCIKALWAAAKWSSMTIVLSCPAWVDWIYFLGTVGVALCQDDLSPSKQAIIVSVGLVAFNRWSWLTWPVGGSGASVWPLRVLVGAQWLLRLGIRMGLLLVFGVWAAFTWVFYLIARYFQTRQAESEQLRRQQEDSGDLQATLRRKLELRRASGRDVKYHVFLSHAGEQKYGFVDHLKAAFEQRCPGVRVFIDEQSMEPGRRAHAQVEEAMEEAPLGVFILSHEFVRKKWPMKELQGFLDKWEAKEAVLMPVLYKLPFDDAKNMMAAFNTQPWVGGEQRPPKNVLKERAEAMKKLIQVTGIRADQVVQNAEAVLVKRVVNKVITLLTELGCMPSSTHSCIMEAGNIVIRPEDCTAELVSLLNTHKVVLLHGQGGIGKTTLSKQAYAQLTGPGSSFTVHYWVSLGMHKSLDDIRHIQRNLLQILTNQDLEVGSAQDGRGKLREHLRDQKIMLVVDNAWSAGLDYNQLTALLPSDLMDVLHPDSRVLITSRDPRIAEELLTGSSHCYAHPMRLLADDAALMLFCMHAFGAPQPPAGKADVAKRIVESCGKLPMALEVSGRFLRRYGSPSDWRLWEEGNLRQTLRDAFDLQRTDSRLDGYNTLFRAYQVSFDALQPEEKELLLDVGSFLKGASWKEVEAYATSRHALEKIESLGFLRQVDGKVELHDTIADFCSWVASKLQGKRYNLTNPCSNPEDARKSDVIGLQLQLQPFRLPSGFRGELSYRLLLLREVTLKLSHASWLSAATLPHLRWLTASGPWPGWEYSLPPSLLSAAPSLRVLSISSFNNKTISFQDLHQLRSLTLENLDYLERLEGMSRLTSLQRLVMSNLTKPLNIVSCLTANSSATCLTALTSLDITRCTVNLSGWRLPHLLGLSIASTSVHGWPQGLEHLTSLSVADTSGAALQNLSVLCLPELSTLKLVGCNTVCSLPQSLNNLLSLTVVSCSSLRQLPLGLIRLTSLKLTRCAGLGSVGLPDSTSLQELAVQECRQLRFPETLGHLAHLHSLHLENCRQTLIPSLQGLASLTSLLLSHCSPSPELQLLGCTSLQSLSVVSCECAIRGLETLSQLSSLIIDRCYMSMQQTLDFRHLQLLEYLKLDNCPGLLFNADLQGLKLLETAVIHRVPRIGVGSVQLHPDTARLSSSRSLCAVM